MKILFLSRWCPHPADNGAKIRISNSLRALAIEHEIALFSFASAEDMPDKPRIDAMRSFCSRLEVVPYRAFRERHVRALAGFVSPKPRSLVDTFNPQMAHAIEQEVRVNRPDVIVASQLDMLQYAVAVPEIPAVLEELELTLYKDAARSAVTARQRLRAGLTWLKIQRYIRRQLPRFAACTVASDHELANIRGIAPDYSTFFVQPNSVDLRHYAGKFGPVQPNTAVYSGALSYHANADAAHFLVADILPRVRAQQPQATVRITGSSDGADVTWLRNAPGVELTGYLEDIRPTIATSAVAVVPLRLGGGTRLKILEAMALGTPVVATGKGAEGLSVRNGENILLADSPDQFASSVLEILSSDTRRERLADSARRLVREQYDAAVLGERLRGIIEFAASRGDHRAHYTR